MCAIGAEEEGAIKALLRLQGSIKALLRLNTALEPWRYVCCRCRGGGGSENLVGTFALIEPWSLNRAVPSWSLHRALAPQI
jgi:hypothetical protein